MLRVRVTRQAPTALRIDYFVKQAWRSGKLAASADVLKVFHDAQIVQVSGKDGVRHVKARSAARASARKNAR